MFEAGLICMALNVYFEARDQPLVGQIAVAETVLNRVHSTLFPDTVCEVVYQGEYYSWNPEIPVRNRCQFSWYCDGLSDKPKDEGAWHKSLQVAHGVLNGYTDSVVEDALWYHAHYVVPDWSRSKRMIVRINDHIFYGSKNVESVYLDHSEGE